MPRPPCPDQSRDTASTGQSPFGPWKPRAAPSGQAVKHPAPPHAGGTTGPVFHPKPRKTKPASLVVLECAKRGDPEAVLNLLADENVRASISLRMTVARALASRTPGVTGWIGPLKYWSLEGDPAVIPALTKLAASDQDPRIRRRAISGLARMLDTSAVPALLLGLDADDRATRVWAIHGLRKLKARDAVPGLLRLLGDRRHRFDAAEALVGIRDERALGPLRKASRHGSPRTRRRLGRHAAALATALGY